MPHVSLFLLEKMAFRARQDIPLGWRDAALGKPVVKTMMAVVRFRSAGNSATNQNIGVTFLKSARISTQALA